MYFFFFFQAEDGIRDLTVTGVQTCALPIFKLYFDTDNNPKSGAQLMFPKIGGFEYVGDLAACADYADKSSACAGGPKAKPTSHWAAGNLERYKRSGQFDKERIVDSMGFFAKKASAQT